MSSIRPPRITRDEAGRRASMLLDDVLRHGERAEGSGVSSASFAASVGVSESRVRKMRDPSAPDVAAGIRELLMADEAVGRPLLAAIVAERRRIHGEPAAPTTREDQAHVAIGTMGGALSRLGSALADGVISDAEAPAVAADARALIRDLERLLSKLGPGEGGVR